MSNVITHIYSEIKNPHLPKNHQFDYLPIKKMPFFNEKLVWQNATDDCDYAKNSLKE